MNKGGSVTDLLEEDYKKCKEAVEVLQSKITEAD